MRCVTRVTSLSGDWEDTPLAMVHSPCHLSYASLLQPGCVIKTHLNKWGPIIWNASLTGLPRPQVSVQMDRHLSRVFSGTVPPWSTRRLIWTHYCCGRTVSQTPVPPCPPPACRERRQIAVRSLPPLPALAISHHWHLLLPFSSSINRFSY